MLRSFEPELPLGLAGVGTSDTARIPPADPSSAEPAVFAGLEIEGDEPGDASVVPWQDMNTCD